MKRTIAVFTLALANVIAMQASKEGVGDTLVIEDVSKVKIETRDTVQRIVINGSKEDPQFHYVQRISIRDTTAVRRSMKSVKDFNKITIKRKNGKESKWGSSLNINLGLDALIDMPESYEFKLWPSIEIGINWLADYQPFGKKNVWSAGLSLDWRNYKTKNNNYFVSVDGMLSPTPFAPEQKDVSASMQIVSLGIPLMYTHYFDNSQDWGITLGAIVNWNFNAKVNRSYEFEGEDYDVDNKKIGHHPVTIDGMAILHTSIIDVYCKYCPMQLFKDGHGPKAHQLSFGLYF